MERTALRISTMAALLNGGTAPYPTLAGEFVYDSLMDDIVDVVGSRRVPVVVVRTDQDVQSYNNNIPMGRQCNLLMEISVVSGSTDATGRARLSWPKTDPALEAMLDLLEWHVYVALRGYSEWAVWFREHYTPIFRTSSTPRYSTPDKGLNRLAVRTLEYTTKLGLECRPKPLHEFAPSVPASLPPTMVNLFEYLATHGAGNFKDKYIAQIKDVLLAYGPVPRPIYPALQRVWVDLPKYETQAMWPIEQSAYLVSVPPTTGGIQVETPDLTIN